MLNKIILRKQLKILTLIVVLLFFIVSITNAYNLSFKHHDYHDTFITYSYIQWSSIDWSDEINISANNWNDSDLPNEEYKPTFQEVVSGRKILIQSDDFGNTGWNGILSTTYNSSTGHVISPSHMSLNDYYSLDSTQRCCTCGHEFGHELGLSDNNDENTIMYKATNIITIPSQDDLNGVAAKSDYCLNFH